MVETGELTDEQQRDFETKRENVKRGRGRTFTPEQRAKGLETLRKKKEENALIKQAEKQKKLDERNQKLESAKKTLTVHEVPMAKEPVEKPPVSQPEAAQPAPAPVKAEKIVDINDISEPEREPEKKPRSKPKKKVEVENSDSEPEVVARPKRGLTGGKSSKELYYEKKLAMLQAEESGYDNQRQAYNDYMRRQDGYKTAQYRYETYMDKNALELARQQAFPRNGGVLL